MEGVAASSAKEIEAQMADFQRRILDIQTGRAQPPKWFKRTGFDTAEVEIEGIGVFLMVAATSGTIEKLDRATDPAAEADLEADAVVESLEKMPEGLKLRREFKMRNKTFEAGARWDNLWKLQSEDRATARQLLQALVGGKLYAMLRMAMVWLSKIDVPTMIGADPEPGSDGDEKEAARPTA